MDIAGVSNETEFGFGGEIIKDLSGAPTGVFNERAQGLISKHVDSNLGVNSDLKAIELAVNACLENGITSFHDAGTSAETIEILRQSIDKNLLKVFEAKKIADKMSTDNFSLFLNKEFSDKRFRRFL